MTDQDMLLRSVNASTLLGNSISLKMVDFLNQVRDQPIGFADLGRDFLGICQILNSLVESLNEHFKTNQPFPEKAIPELMRVLAKTADDFRQLQTLLQKFMDFEKGGTLAKLQKTWRLFFADKDIAKVRTSLQENRGALNMTMLLTNINPGQGTGHLGYENSLLAARLEQQHYTQPGPSGLNTASSYAGPAFTADHEHPIPVSTGPLVPAMTSGAKRIPIKVDRSQLPRRTPKSSQDATSAALTKALYSAVEGQSTKVVEQLLDRGVSPDTGRETNSVLTATYNEDTPTLKLLLEFGANPDSPDEHGNTPLRVSCDGREEQARLLLEWGADPNISTPDWTALPWACDSRDEKIVSLLLQYGADPNLISNNGETGLVYVCHEPFEYGMVKDMLDWGADPNKKNGLGMTPLEAACSSDQPDIAKLLLGYHADPNLVGTSHPLAAAMSSPACLRVLIAGGVNVGSCEGYMELAVQENSPEVVEILLSAGDPNVRREN